MALPSLSGWRSFTSVTYGAVLMLTLVHTASGASATIPTACDICTCDSQFRKINCSGLGLHDVPLNIPLEIQTLYVSYCCMFSVDWLIDATTIPFCVM